ncbi:MAG: hypothetical protein HYV90_00845 [Candidatus Woesebacteria bacterium]|nr:MAG: hypothetical protein HYV90_00845 [Candidatus Woesebacteria bacterium]
MSFEEVANPDVLEKKFVNFGKQFDQIKPLLTEAEPVGCIYLQNSKHITTPYQVEKNELGFKFVPIPYVHGVGDANGVDSFQNFLSIMTEGFQIRGGAWNVKIYPAGTKEVDYTRTYASPSKTKAGDRYFVQLQENHPFFEFMTISTPRPHLLRSPGMEVVTKTPKDKLRGVILIDDLHGSVDEKIGEYKQVMNKLKIQSANYTFIRQS